MGSGKSTLGTQLANRLGVAFVDLDAEIERRAGCTIADLVRMQGEVGLRRHELEALRTLAVSAPAACVVATGGGVVETPEAHALLRALGRIVWLAVAPEIAVARLDGAARASRPLLDSNGTWRRRWERRETLYRELADAVVATHPDTIDASLERLVALVRPTRS